MSVARHGQGFVLKIGEQGRTAISLSAIGMTGRTVADLGGLKISQTTLSRRAQTAAMLQIEIVRIVSPPLGGGAGDLLCFPGAAVEQVRGGVGAGLEVEHIEQGTGDAVIGAGDTLTA